MDEKIVEKDFFDILNYQRKQSNNLLGYFSSDGSYKISQELVAQLLLVPKKFDRFDNNLVYVASVLKRQWALQPIPIVAESRCGE